MLYAPSYTQYIFARMGGFPSPPKDFDMVFRNNTKVVPYE